MKKILLLFVVLFVFAPAKAASSEFEQNYETAIQYKKDADYQKAVKFFLKALKEKEADKDLAQSLCFEISDCFLKAGDEKSALKFVKVAVRNYGATRNDIKSSSVLNEGFVLSVETVMNIEYNELHREYLIKNHQLSKAEYAELMR